MSRFPCSSVVPFLLMVTWWVLKVAVHPASHSLPIDMSELCVRSGKMCASLAALGNCGRSRVQAVLLDRRNAPFGNPTVMVVLVVLSVLCGSFVLMFQCWQCLFGVYLWGGFDTCCLFVRFLFYVLCYVSPLDIRSCPLLIHLGCCLLLLYRYVLPFCLCSCYCCGHGVHGNHGTNNIHLDQVWLPTWPG
jgi:hypothetical protein